MQKTERDKHGRIFVRDLKSLKLAIQESIDTVVVFYLTTGFNEGVGVALWDIVERRGLGGCCLSHDEFNDLKDEFGRRVRFVQGSPR